MPTNEEMQIELEHLHLVRAAFSVSQPVTALSAKAIKTPDSTTPPHGLHQPVVSVLGFPATH